MSDSTTRKTSTRSSRRDFLRTSTAAVGTAMAANLAVGRSAHAAGSDILKVGLIGCGGRGSGAAANAMNADKNAKLVAMADVFKNKVVGSRDRLKKQYADQVAVDDDHCFTDFDGFQKVIDSGVDVVLIACASRFHPQYMTAAIEAGKHVFVEKPHFVDAPGAKVVEAACKQAKEKKLSVVSGLCWRYHTGVQETIKRIQDGAIGDIVAIQELYMRTPYRVDVVRNPEWTELQWQFRNWYHFRWLSGDDVLQSLVHSLDKASWLMNDEPPKLAFGVGGRSQTFDIVHGNQHDHAAMTFEYDNGIRTYGFSRAQAGCFNETSDNVLGTKGRCNVTKHTIEGETNWKYDGPKCNMYDNEHVELFKSIRAGKPINNGKRMIASTMLGVLGRTVCYTGKKLTWDQMVNSQQTSGPAEVNWDTVPPTKPGEDGRYPVPVPGFEEFS
jgi:myo-inositol 2-dehydrogenase / D-chiro-inositol 1-dehydrogenase